MQEDQQITFLSDGADNLRDLQQLMHPEAERVLDWFHLTMRLTVLTQFAKGLCQSDPEHGAELLDIPTDFGALRTESGAAWSHDPHTRH